MHVILIDTNIYIDLYKTYSHETQRALSMLPKIKSSIFITEHIAREVKRNKLSKTKEFLEQHFGKIAMPNISVPKNVMPLDDELHKEIHKGLEEIKEKRRELAYQIETAISKLLLAISTSTDPVSKILNPIFINAIQENEHEISRARRRKELGNPPGKRSDVLGDQIIWEQLLTYLNSHKNSEVWIISRDSDYYTFYEGTKFLNPLLREELEHVEVGEIHLYDNLFKAMEEFLLVAKPQSEHLPTLEDLSNAASHEEMLLRENRRILSPDEVLRKCEWEKCDRTFVVKTTGRTALRRFCSGTCRGKASEERTGKR